MYTELNRVFMYHAVISGKAWKTRIGPTYSHLESFIELEVPHLRHLPMLSMMPLKRGVATENVLTVLLGNEVWSKLLM